MAEHMPDRLLRVLQRLATQRTGDPQASARLALRRLTRKCNTSVHVTVGTERCSGWRCYAPATFWQCPEWWTHDTPCKACLLPSQQIAMRKWRHIATRHSRFRVHLAECFWAFVCRGRLPAGEQTATRRMCRCRRQTACALLGQRQVSSRAATATATQPPPQMRTAAAEGGSRRRMACRPAATQSHGPGGWTTWTLGRTATTRNEGCIFHSGASLIGGQSTLAAAPVGMPDGMPLSATGTRR